jgi:HSP20 family protein
MFFEDPHYVITQNEDNVILDIELPGFSGEELEISTERGQLSVTGQRKGKSVKLKFTMPRDVNIDGISASMAHGILTIILPQAESMKKRRILIGS